MGDLLISIDTARKERRIRQSELADALKVTQGHYSKVVAGLVPLSSKLEERMRAWLAQVEAVEIKSDRAHRVRQIAETIRAQCAELISLTTAPD